VSSSHRSNRLRLSHRDPYAVRRGGYAVMHNCHNLCSFHWASVARYCTEPILWEKKTKNLSTQKPKKLWKKWQQLNFHLNYKI